MGNRSFIAGVRAMQYTRIHKEGLPHVHAPDGEIIYSDSAEAHEHIADVKHSAIGAGDQGYPTDANGTVFDGTIHAVDTDGLPSLTGFGTFQFRRKEGT